MKLGYARVSSRSQDLFLQVSALEAAGCEKIFTETASGAKVDRIEFTKLLQFARDGQDEIVVWKLDRLGRSLRQLLTLFDDLSRREIGITSLTEQIDASTAAGKLTVHLFCALNEFERQNIADRCRAGREAAVARGRTGGRPRSMSETKLRMAKALMADDQLSMKQIAAECGIAVSSLYRYVKGGRQSIIEASRAT